MESQRVWTVRNHKDELHIVPRNDYKQHRLFGCWCNPKFEKDRLALSPVWVHKMGKRSESED